MIPLRNGCSKVSYTLQALSHGLSCVHQDSYNSVSRWTFKRYNNSTSNAESILIKETLIGFYEYEHKRVQAKDSSNIYKSRTMNLALCKMCLQIAQKEKTFELCVLISKMVWKENLKNRSVCAPWRAQVKLYFPLEYWDLDLDILLCPGEGQCMKI